MSDQYANRVHSLAMTELHPGVPGVARFLLRRQLTIHYGHKISIFPQRRVPINVRTWVATVPE